jgi:hypothetical protein
VAARLNDIEQGNYEPFFRDRLHLKIGENGARRAAKTRRQKARDQGVRPPFQDWLLVDELALGLEKVVIRVPGASRGSGEVRARLLALPQIRQLIEAEVTGDLYAIGVIRNGEERRALRAQLEELSDERPHMEPVAYETHEPARAMWRTLARRAGPEDDLSADSNT